MILGCDFGKPGGLSRRDSPANFYADLSDGLNARRAGASNTC